MPARPQPARHSGPDAILVHMLQQWAREYARICRGGVRYPDGTWHVDGWPPVSINGRLKDQAEGASQVQTRQHFAEVYSADALLVRRAMVGMATFDLYLIQLHYLVRKPIHVRASSIGVHRTRYLELVSMAHAYLRGKIDGLKVGAGE